MSDWYVGITEPPLGPVSKSVLAQMVSGGQINRQTMVIREGIPDWTPLGDVPELRDILPAPTQSYTQPTQNYTPSGGSSAALFDVAETKWKQQKSFFHYKYTWEFTKNGSVNRVNDEVDEHKGMLGNLFGSWKQNGNSVTVNENGSSNTYELRIVDNDTMQGTKSGYGSAEKITLKRKKGLFG